MSATFTHTIRSLHADRSRRKSIWLLPPMIMAAAWTGWFFQGRVCVYELSETARLEACYQARPVVARQMGQIAQTQLVLGKQVRAGELLVQLDDQTPRLAQEEGRARINDIQLRLAAVTEELDAQEQAATAHVKASVVSVDEQQARIDEAQAHSMYAVERLERGKHLKDKNAISLDELAKLRADSQANQAGVKALQSGGVHMRHKNEVEQRDRHAALKKLQCQRAELIGQLEIENATLRRLEREVELCQVRAPVSGRIGQVAESPVGAAVTAGEKLAHIVPACESRAVAFFPVASSGRIRPGQAARLRMDGFSWTHYGHIPATVAKVATEPDGSLLRVEFDLPADANRQIPIQHGLSGLAEVEVEKISPGMLLLRRIGGMLDNESLRERVQIAQAN